jgi:hypothetical protein
MQKVEVAVAFGFGIQENETGNLLAGAANDSIMHWIRTNTEVKYIIAQKGCLLSEFNNPETTIIEMHPHGNNYVNTLEVASFALHKIDSLKNNNSINNNKVIVLAHNYQIERAAWTMKSLSEIGIKRASYQFILPNWPQMHFLKNQFKFIIYQ